MTEAIPAIARERSSCGGGLGSGEAVRRGSKISDHQIFAFFLEVWLSEERTLSSAQSGPVDRGFR